jgi:hypothetical protein
MFTTTNIEKVQAILLLKEAILFLILECLFYRLSLLLEDRARVDIDRLEARIYFQNWRAPSCDQKIIFPRCCIIPNGHFLPADFLRYAENH